MRAFYVLVVTQMLSMIGSRMTGMAIGIRVFADTGASAPLLLVAFFTELPPMLIGSLAGVWIDRMDRRIVTMLADAGQALATLLLVFALASSHFQLWQLYVLCLVQGVCAAFQEPARAALVAELVPVEQLNRANAVAGTSHPLAGVVAPALTGMLYVAIGITGIVLIDMATFVIAVLVLLGMRIPRAERDASSEPAPQFFRELQHGFRYLRTRPALWTLVIYAACANFLLNGSLGLSLPYLLTLSGDEQVTGVVMAVESLGGLIGGVLLAAYGPSIRSRVKLLKAGMLVVSAMFLLYGTLRAPFALALAIFVLVASLQVCSLFTTMLQLHTPSELHGRVLSIAQQLGYLGATSSFLLAGPLVDHVLEPAVGSPGWAPFAFLLGDRPGAGMGLLFVLAGIGLFVLTVGVFARPTMRSLDGPSSGCTGGGPGDGYVPSAMARPTTNDHPRTSALRSAMLAGGWSAGARSLVSPDVDLKRHSVRAASMRCGASEALNAAEAGRAARMRR